MASLTCSYPQTSSTATLEVILCFVCGVLVPMEAWTQLRFEAHVGNAAPMFVHVMMVGFILGFFSLLVFLRKTNRENGLRSLVYSAARDSFLIGMLSSGYLFFWS